MTKFVEKSQTQLKMLLSILEFIEVPYTGPAGGVVSSLFQKDNVIVFLHLYTDHLRFCVGYEGKNKYEFDPNQMYILEYHVNSHRYECPTKDTKLTHVINMAHRTMLNITELELLGNES